MTVGDLTGLLFALSPAMTGALMGVYMALWRFHSEAGIPMLFAGVGGVTGYLIVAVFIRILDSLGLYVFNISLLVGLVTSVLIAAILLSTQLIHTRTASPQKVRSLRHDNRLVVPLSGLLGILIGQSLYQAAISPVSSWDGLGLWTNWAESFLRFDFNLEGRSEQTRAEDGVFPWKHPRHPPTVYHLSAFTGHALEQAHFIRGWLISWTAIWLCGAAIVWGLVRSASGSVTVSAAATIGFCSLPLLENHSILVGYADLWIVVVTVASSAMFAFALSRGGRAPLVFALVLAIIPFGLKNTGPLYVFTQLTPLVVLVGLKKSPRLFVMSLCVAAVAVYWVSMTGFDVKILGQRYALSWGAMGQIVFGGHKMSFASYPMLDILNNEMWALFVNQSFSVVVLLGVVMSAVLVGNNKNIEEPKKLALQYLLLSSLMLLLVFMAPQLVTQYAERFAVPNSDLGNSRFIMAFGPVLLLAFGFTPKILFKSHAFS